MRRAVVLAAVAAAATVAAAPASAGRECRGFKQCVPITGPWVIAPTVARVEYQLTCPKGFIVGGLDADVSRRGVDVGFLGDLGSPVNPGITTSRSALFLARLVQGADPAASFRPHIGCIPASGGGGQRVPTARRAAPPGGPAEIESAQFAVGAGTHRFSAACARGEHLVSYTHAIGFYTPQPPTLTQVRSLHAVFAVRNGRVRVTAAGAAGLPGVVQVDLLCTR